MLRDLLAMRFILLSAAVSAALQPPPSVAVPGGNVTLGETSQLPLPAALTRGIPSRDFGDYDESPWAVSTPVSALNVLLTEVTNLQFEAYQPEHAAMRGRHNFSFADNEAVVFVTWFDAASYCSWLAANTGAAWRLPSEAEAEYLIKAGSVSPFPSGASFSDGVNQCISWWPGDAARDAMDSCSHSVPLTVGRFHPSTFGLFDTTGNVEEWTADWFSPYGGSPDARFPTPATFKVTRGGSHSTELYYLRSANRAGALPTDSSAYIGFRCVADSMAPVVAPNSPAAVSRATRWLAAAAPSSALPKAASGFIGLRAIDLLRAPGGNADQAALLDTHGGLRRRPPPTTCASCAAAFAPLPPPPIVVRQFVHVSDPNALPWTQHNHDPALAVCASGDLLAVWFSTIEETGRESGLVFSHLRANTDGGIDTNASWPDAAVLWHAPDRTELAPLLWRDDTAGGRVFLFHGQAAAATWGALAVVARHTDDCGATWSPASLVLPDHSIHHQPVNTMARLSDGRIFMPTDNVTGGCCGTALHFSADGGYTWDDAWPASGEYIGGIHGTVVELRNASLLAFGRGADIAGTMAASRSDDGGKTWSYAASPWPAIGGGQRASLLRAAQGALVFCSFATSKPLAVPTVCGELRNVSGLYCAASNDEGKSWPYRRVMADDAPAHVREQLDGSLFLNSEAAGMGEGNGYTVARQSPVDAAIHLITSRNHYAFTLDWLTSPAPC